VQAWNSNPQYSHGFLVPFFAVFLLLHRREKVQRASFRPNIFGLALLALGLGCKVFAAYGHYVSLDPLSLIPCVAGLVFLAGGWTAWTWAWPSVLFLVFMIPLPYFAAVAMSAQLQNLATVVSTFLMQTMGMPAIAEGNVILLNDHEIGVVEACSGLRMLVVFFAQAAAVVLLIDRPWIDKAIILVSAVPIALISNILRITVTGMMYDMGYGEFASHFFHDVAGWLMMPLALAMLGIELAILRLLFIDDPKRVLPGKHSVSRSVVPRPASSRLGRRNQVASNRESRVARPQVNPVPEKAVETSR
ncbi:MAG: exosortase/archaeosortase family protein, partial [Gemmataceae bacterium]